MAKNLSLEKFIVGYLCQNEIQLFEIATNVCQNEIQLFEIDTKVCQNKIQHFEIDTKSYQESSKMVTEKVGG